MKVLIMKKTLQEEKNRILQIMRQLNEQSFNNEKPETDDISDTSDDEYMKKQSEYSVDDIDKELLPFVNNNLSGYFNSEDGESNERVLVLDLPKSNPNFDEDYFNDAKERETNGRSSHGIEGNPGGWVSSEYFNIEDMGDFYRETHITRYILDV